MVGTESDAGNTADQYGGVGQVEQVGTVVLAYNKTPTAEESEPVMACLKEQGVG
jgi:hypothetical protein